MPLEPWQLQVNGRVHIGGEDGTITQTDNLHTYVLRDAGHAHVYSTDHVREKGEVPEDKEESTEESGK